MVVVRNIRAQDEVYRAGKFGPFLAESRAFLAAEGSEVVVLALPAFWGCGPSGFEEAAFFQAVEGRIERAFLCQQLAATGLLDGFGDFVAVGCAVGMTSSITGSSAPRMRSRLSFMDMPRVAR